MAEPKIANIVFADMRGEQIPERVEAMETRVRRYNSKLVYITQDARPRAVQLETVELLSSDKLAKESVDYYNSLKGTLVSVTEKTGRKLSKIMVHEVYGVTVDPVLQSLPYGYTWRVRATWIVSPSDETEAS
jgi:hypothetical protein